MKILIATDGSEFGTAAVEFAAQIIDNNGATDVKIVTVIEPAAGTELETIIESTEEILDPKNPDEQAAAEMLKVAEVLFEMHCGKEDIAISSKVLPGPAARSIVEEADRWNADMIVLGTHGRGFWSKALLGSVSDRVASHAHCSVLIVRQAKAS